MIIVGFVNTKEEASEIEKIYERFILGCHIQYLSREFRIKWTSHRR
jgi:hypothetical protein